MKRFCLTIAAVLALGLPMCGCRSVTDDEGRGVDHMPWNTPASWEQSVLGMPF